MKNPEELIGRKVRGFKFETTDIEKEKIYNEYMEIEGVITIYYKDWDSFGVQFKGGDFLTYPADQIEAHLVEENEIPTLTDGVMMLVSDDEVRWCEREVFFMFNKDYYVKSSISKNFIAYKNAKPIEKEEPTKEEQLTAILGSSEKVAEIMELFNDKK